MRAEGGGAGAGRGGGGSRARGRGGGGKRLFLIRWQRHQLRRHRGVPAGAEGGAERRPPALSRREVPRGRARAAPQGVPAGLRSAARCRKDGRGRGIRRSTREALCSLSASVGTDEAFVNAERRAKKDELTRKIDAGKKDKVDPVFLSGSANGAGFAEDRPRNAASRYLVLLLAVGNHKIQGLLQDSGFSPLKSGKWQRWVARCRRCYPHPSDGFRT